MTKRWFGEPDVVVSGLPAMLDQYEQDVCMLVRCWRADPDMDRYACVSAEVDDLRRRCASLPRVGVPWVALLISHTELMYALWRVLHRPGEAIDLEAELCAHRQLVDALRTKCKRVLAATWAASELRVPGSDDVPSV